MSTTYRTQIDLSADVRTGAVALLQARLSDGLDLEAQAKQAHWNVAGPNFIQLHELFDRVHAEIETFVDTIAERITTLSHIADGRIKTTGANSGLSTYPIEAATGDDHLKALATVVAQFGKLAREDIGRAESLGDTDTADLFTQISRATDKQLWLLEAYLRGR